MQPLPSSVQRLWKAIALAVGVVSLVALVALDLLARSQADDDVSWFVPPLVVPVVIGALVLGIGWLVAGLRYRAWRFELTDEWIQARWGVIYHHSATIPRNRVQTMTSQNGPVDRLLGLTSVTVHTAGAGAPNLSIPHLEDPTVEWLRGELASGRGD